MLFRSDGTRYAGWQIQKNSRQKAAGRRQKPTVQGTLERVLRRILQEPVKVIGSGRTDAGVHALAQVAHVRTPSALSCHRLLRSLNQLLPPDLAVTRIEDAEESFHARFRAKRKRYRYRLFTGPVVPPFIRRYVCHLREPVNVALMQREAESLRGRHDFNAFARTGSGRRSTIRTISEIHVRRLGDEVFLEIEGNGFLHTMVRSIAGTLVDVVRGRLPHGTARRILATRDRRQAGTTAPPQGLALVSVSYSPAD